jgi:hypothetical protein
LVWVGCNIFSTFYREFWDCFIDWGLCRTFAKGKWGLRKKTHYPNAVYYAGICIDFLGYWLWLVTAFINDGEGTFWSSFFWLKFFIFVQLFRRWFWCLIRVENEQTNNLEKYRTILEIPELDTYEEDMKLEENNLKKMVETVFDKMRKSTKID